MRLAKVLAVCVLAQACTARNHAPARSEPAAPPATIAPADVHEPKAIKIAAFDCERQESFPGEPPQRGLIAPGAGIRGWHAGGPEGANWNVDDLRCAVRIESTCTKGQIDVVLKIGRSRVAQRQIQIARSPVDAELTVPFKRWKGSFDERDRKRRPAVEPMFDTAVFRALAELTCEVPDSISPANSRYPDITDEDTFVAGFAYGE